MTGKDRNLGRREIGQPLKKRDLAELARWKSFFFIGFPSLRHPLLHVEGTSELRSFDWRRTLQEFALLESIHERLFSARSSPNLYAQFAVCMERNLPSSGEPPDSKEGILFKLLAGVAVEGDSLKSRNRCMRKTVTPFQLLHLRVTYQEI